MISRKNLLRAYAMLGLVTLFWAGNSIVGRAVRDEIPPFFLAFVRWTGALLVVGPFALRHLVRDRDTLRHHWPIIVLLGLVGVAAFNGFLYFALRYTTATNGILVQALIPGLVLVANAALFRDRPSPYQIAGVALSTLGVLVIVFQADLRAMLDLRFGFGDAMVFCGVVGWALYTSLLRLRPPIHPLSFLAATFTIGALAMAPLAAMEWREIVAMRWSAGVFGAFAYVAILPSVAAYFFYNAAVGMIGSGPAGQTISLMPLLGAVLAAVTLHEPLGLHHWAGMVLICVGILVAALMSRRQTAENALEQG